MTTGFVVFCSLRVSNFCFDKISIIEIVGKKPVLIALTNEISIWTK